MQKAAKKSFRQSYSLEQRSKMFKEAQQKDPNLIVVVVQKDPKCTAFPDLIHNRFKIGKQNKFFQMYTAIRKRILEMDEKYQSHSLFLFTKRILPNKEMSVGEVWSSQKDSEDNLLYLKYSNMQPFGTEENLIKNR